MVVRPAVSVLINPSPETVFLALRKARKSTPPEVSHTPAVADHVNNGIESTGNPLTPDWEEQPAEQATVRLCPTVNTPALETKMKASPEPDESVAVAPFWIEYTVFPNRTLQALPGAQPAPIVRVFVADQVTPKSESCPADAPFA